MRRRNRGRNRRDETPFNEFASFDSCTVGGRYYVSFVVERAQQPLPSITAEVGVDLGLDRLAVTSDGEIIDNPRHLRSAQRRLGRAQRALCRKQRGGANRRKAVRRVAVLHRKVRETRLDHHHKLALRLVRDNQAVHLENLSVAGLARTRLARSIHDAGWSTLVRLIEEKATHYGRAVVKVDRVVPVVAAVLGLRAPRRAQATFGQVVDLPGVRCRARP